jgi:hypothetical protein
MMLLVAWFLLAGDSWYTTQCWQSSVLEGNTFVGSGIAIYTVDLMFIAIERE